MRTIADKIAQELNVLPQQVISAIELIDNGDSVPFIARYRKEKTQGLTDNHLRVLEQRLTYLRELDSRRGVILKNIEQQGLLTSALQKEIIEADNKTRLEDLYLPFKPKRRTKGQVAIEAGLKPLADKLFSSSQLTPENEAQSYINCSKDFPDIVAVLAGASAILVEHMAEQANLIEQLRRFIKNNAFLSSRVVKSKQQEAKKYRDYFEHSEKLAKVPAHRALAMFRGKNEGFLRLSITAATNANMELRDDAERIIMDFFQLRLSSQPGAKFLTQIVQSAWKEKLLKSLETEFFGQLKEQAEKSSIKVFADNLKDLLMAAPAGDKVTLALDPGLRTGCKLAVVDKQGTLLHTSTIFPHEPQNNWDKSVRTIVNLIRQHKVELIAIGNGTASRETDKLAGEAISSIDNCQTKKIIVSEAGASVYSASEFAANEFPDLDVSLRGAVSIGRRLQDPLAELVKIEPKAIGVGQYQHDVTQSQLTLTLDAVVEDCVNAVGVELNTASAALLTRVAGLNKTIANNIVHYREQNGRFNNRKSLLKVPRLGAKAFEQAAGFLRINNGDNLIEQSGVHPETYGIVDKLIAKLNCDLESVLNNANLLDSLDVSELVSDEFGLLTVNDVIEELSKPGRDPRGEFKTASFKAGINNIKDLTVGMVLEGVISNVANFGAFVDIGVHQDGLVHISSLTNKFVSDPREIVKAGDVVKVKVTELDIDRKRISLTMRLDDEVVVGKSESKQKTDVNKPQKSAKNHQKGGGNNPRKQNKSVNNAAMGNAFADAFAKLKK